MNAQAAPYNLMMLSGDNTIARGIDGAFYQMLERFSRYWQRIDILVPSAADAKPTVIHGNVHVHPAIHHRLLQPLFIRQLGNQLLAERDYHLIVSHDFGFFYNGIGAWWLLRGKQIPLISEIHHVEGYPLATNWREKLWRWAAMRYLPSLAERAAAIRVVNRQEVPDLLREMGIPDEKILVLYSLYMDFDIFQPASGKQEKDYDILFVGRLASNKGIMLLMDAIIQIKQRYPHIKLAIRGEGPLKAQIDAQISRHHLENNITFLPRVAHTTDMAHLYHRARMLVCASTVEGNPRVTIEAMACGIPVISTRVGIMPDVVRDGENGFLVDHDAATLAQRIGLLMDDESLCERIGERGRQRVQRFDADQMIASYAKAYHTVIQQH